jgi:hypothetical protein
MDSTRRTILATGAAATAMAALPRLEEFKGEYRCIPSDLRDANGGHSSWSLEIDRLGMHTPMTISG